MTQTDKPLLEVQDLIKTYPAGEGGFLSGLLGGGERVPALNGVSFVLREGEILGLIGESGSGKSALARLIAGEEKPDKGQIHFMGKLLSSMSENEVRPLRRHLRYLPEDAFTGLTNDPKNRVDRLLTDFFQRNAPGEAGASGGAGAAAAAEMLGKVGLSSDYLERFPSQMSGGEKQRLAIARAMMLRPRLIVADEPVSNLDLNTRTSMLNLMRRLGREYGTAFIFISHNPSMVRYFASNGRIAIMFAGRLMELLPGHTLFEGATHPYTKSLLSVNPAPSPLPGAFIDLQTARSEVARVDSNSMALDTLEGELSAEGNMAAAAQVAANRPGCPFYRWCPERFERCPSETPQLLTVTNRRLEGRALPLPDSEIVDEHKAACFWYINQ